MKSNPSKQEQTKSEMTTNFRQNIPNLFNSKQMGAHKQSMEFGMYEGSSTKMARASKPDVIDKKRSVLVQAKKRKHKRNHPKCKGAIKLPAIPMDCRNLKSKTKETQSIGLLQCKANPDDFWGGHAL